MLKAEFAIPTSAALCSFTLFEKGPSIFTFTYDQNLVALRKLSAFSVWETSPQKSAPEEGRSLVPLL